MSDIALVVAFAALALNGILFVVVRKLIEANRLVGEALDEIAKLLEGRYK